MTSRVVVTGLGVVAPNGIGVAQFKRALYEERSGIRFVEGMKEIGAACQVGGIPEGAKAIAEKTFRPDQLIGMSEAILYASLAAVECWRDAGFQVPIYGDETVDWETGAIIGTGIGSAEVVAVDVIPKVIAREIRRIPSTIVERTMGSSQSARVGGILGLGGQVTSNSSACSTGNEAVVDAFYAVKSGRVKRILAGGTEGSSTFTWAPFDAMRILSRGYNDNPARASRPMSATAKGFVPSSGAGILMIESLESAQERGAKIYAELLSAFANCGGQRNGGSMTLPNNEGVIRCIRRAILDAGIPPGEIDFVGGHLTGTMADVREVENWRTALECAATAFPKINSSKSLFGHALGAAGGLECVAAILQLTHGFVHGSVNCEDLHPSLQSFAKSVVHRTIDFDLRTVAKASFGFGDVNSCLIFRRW